MNFLGYDDREKPSWGGKAGRLHALKSLGFQVAHGFVILPHENLTDSQWLEAIERIGGFPLAVRSSGTIEDGEAASFAGQFETVLGVRDLKGVHEAVEKVRRSVFSERVRAYTGQDGPNELSGIPVLIQKLIDSRVSGVSFSLNPLTGVESELLIEAVPGFGEALVSGVVSPTEIRVRQSGELISQTVRNGLELRSDHLERIREITLRMAEIFGGPQDVEWCFDEKDTLWVLQSRPITALQFRRDRGEWTNADFRDGGVSSEACAGMMFSLYRRVMQASMTDYLRSVGLLKSGESFPWIDMFYGRPYWNVGAVKSLLRRVPGFHEPKFDRDLGIRRRYSAEAMKPTPARAQNILVAVPVLWKLYGNFRKNLALTKGYRRGFLGREKELLSRLEEGERLTERELSELFLQVVELHFKTEFDYFTTIYNSANYQTELKSTFAFFEKISGLEISYVKAISGLGDVCHTEMQTDFERLVGSAERGLESRGFRDELGRFVEKHYYQSDFMFNLLVPRWGEDPGIVLDKVVKALLHRGGESVRRSATDHFRDELSRVKERLSWPLRLCFPAVEARLRKARLFLKRREEMRDFSSRTYHIVRKALLLLADRWARRGWIRHREDLFFVSIEDVMASLKGETDFSALRAKIAQGRSSYRSFRNFKAPNEFGAPFADVPVSTHEGRHLLEGTGSSSGIVEAPVFVANSLQEAQAVPDGWILIAPFTDPGWTPLFHRVAGIVTETGGILSHAAVIARELKIPAVLNVSAARSRLKTGERVLLDGDLGTVRILSPR